MHFQTITSEKEAKKIWNMLSPHQVIDDEWEFRRTFFKYLPYSLMFVTKFDGSKPVGLLPLQKNTGVGLMPPYAKSKNNFLEFFGGDDTDDNTLFTKNGMGENIYEFINKIHFPMSLAPLRKDYKNMGNISFYEDKYYLNISNYSTFEDFLKDKWGKSSRKKILQQIRRLYREHKIEVVENNYEDIDLLADLNVQRFGEESSFIYPYRRQIFKELTKHFKVFMLTILVDNKKEAVSYGIHYKDTYVGMNAGVKGNIEDLPKLLIMLQIDRAIKLGCKTYDAGKGDSGWKEMYKLDKIPQYKLNISN